MERSSHPRWIVITMWNGISFNPWPKIQYSQLVYCGIVQNRIEPRMELMKIDKQKNEK